MVSASSSVSFQIGDEARAQRVDRSAVDRIVRQVELVRPRRLRDEPKQLLDARSAKRAVQVLRLP